MSKKKERVVSLSSLNVGDAAVIQKLLGDKMSCQRLMALGIVKDQEIFVDTKAPMGDPCIYSVLGYRLSIRREDANKIIVSHPKGSAQQHV